jgi:hypothetical protein
VVGIIIGVTRAMKRSTATRTYGTTTSVATPPGAPASTLTESYATTNKLLTIHYPPDFAVKTLDGSTLIVTRNFGGGEDEVVTFGALVSPITDDAHELGRILLASLSKNVASKGGTFTKNSEHPATCLGKYPGVEVVATFVLPPVAPYVSKSCFFMNATHGYEVRYDVPKSRIATEVPLLESIENATELTL